MKHLKYKQVMELVPLGIGPAKYKGAFRDADYLGNPGKDLFFWIDQTSPPETDMKSVASLLSNQFPSSPPHNPIQYGACVRYIYGCFEKQGILRSKSDKKRMVSQKQEWEQPSIFISHLFESLESNKNNFGLALLSEQMAHRYGDRYVIDKDRSSLPLMEEYYRKSYEYALACGSKKHLMTTFYWEGRYWAEINNKEKAIHYYRQAVKAANRFCPDARQSLREKIMDEFKYLSKHDPEYSSFLSHWRKHASNKAVKAVVKQAPKGR